jgi:16S rRNA (guanine1516-N2)-methyltransferase
MSSPDLNIAVAASTPTQHALAAALAEELGLPLSDLTDPSFRLLLVYTEERLELRQTGAKAPGPVYVDFLGGKADYRRRYGSSKDEELLRAVTSKRHQTPKVLDATAGLGRDAFVLASHGCQVTMLERRPIIAALLADGLKRAALAKDTERIARRMKLLPGDSLEIMQKLVGNKRPEVIYLDPMYPHRRKSAMIKKEMLVMRMLAGDDDDSGELLEISLKTAGRRVVVKRPSFAPPLADRKPDLVCKTKNNRFDVYLVSPPGE